MKFGHLLATYYEERRAQMELGCEATTEQLQEVPRAIKLYDSHEKRELLSPTKSPDTLEGDCAVSSSSSTGSDYPHSPVVTASWRKDSDSSDAVIRTDKPKSYWRATEEEEQRVRENCGEVEHQYQSSGELHPQTNTTDEVVNESEKSSETESNRKPVRFWLGADNNSDIHEENPQDRSDRPPSSERHHLDNHRDVAPPPVSGQDANVDGGRYHGMFQMNPFNYEYDNVYDKVDQRPTLNGEGLLPARDYELSRYRNDERLHAGYREGFNNNFVPSPTLVSFTKFVC